MWSKEKTGEDPGIQPGGGYFKVQKSKIMYTVSKLIGPFLTNIHVAM